jgi:4-hydroxybenzoate polyprenyltransferase
LLLYAGGFFWTLGYDTIYAHQDREDDMLAGIKSTALKLDAYSKIWVGVFYGLAFLLIWMACQRAAPGITVFIYLLPAAVHMAWQMKSWDMRDAGSALRVFKSNRDFGLIVLIGIAALTFFYSP